MAQLATSQSEDALDIVQDAMMTLASRYAGRDPAEWGPLFHRILQNRIRDWYRRQKVKNRLMSWFRFADEDEDPIETAVDTHSQGPLQSLQHEDMSDALQQALQDLPLRQQQTFLLRAWEGLDVAQTASAMGISGGSVKTHYSRAVQALRERLGEFYHAQ